MRVKALSSLLAGAWITLLASHASADPVTILAAEVTPAGEGWRVAVTLEHPDTGWDHYADAWQIVDAEGNEIATRELAHPHVNEQPFTRSLGNVMLDERPTSLRLRARCSVDGWGEIVEIPVTP